MTNYIENIDKLGEGIKENTNLKHFTLWINENKIYNLDKIGEGLAYNKTL